MCLAHDFFIWGWAEQLQRAAKVCPMMEGEVAFYDSHFRTEHMLTLLLQLAKSVHERKSGHSLL